MCDYLSEMKHVWPLSLLLLWQVVYFHTDTYSLILGGIQRANTKGPKPGNLRAISSQMDSGDAWKLSVMCLLSCFVHYHHPNYSTTCLWSFSYFIIIASFTFFFLLLFHIYIYIYIIEAFFFITHLSKFCLKSCSSKYPWLRWMWWNPWVCIYKGLK